MNEQSYEAWDGKRYKWPPPSGWYLASDNRWWPENYGPKNDQQPASPQNIKKIEPEVRQNTDFNAGFDTRPPTNKSADMGFSTPPQQSSRPVQDSFSSQSRDPNLGSFSRKQAPPVDYKNDSSEFSIDYSKDSKSNNLVKWLSIGVGVMSFIVLGLFLFQMFSSKEGTADNPRNIGDNVGLTLPDQTDPSWVIKVNSASSQVPAGEVSSFAGDVNSSYYRANVTVGTKSDSATLDQVKLMVSNDGVQYSLDDACMSQAGALNLSGSGSNEGFICWKLSSANNSKQLLVVAVDEIDGDVYIKLN